MAEVTPALLKICASAQASEWANVKKASGESNGAIWMLRFLFCATKCLASAVKKQGRETKEGKIAARRRNSQAVGAC